MVAKMDAASGQRTMRPMAETDPRSVGLNPGQ